MNEFTKEELEAIKRALITHDFRYPDLMNKTQSLIDNYCEHKRTYEDSSLLKFCNDCQWIGDIDRS